jgi:hypothetical protein
MGRVEGANAPDLQLIFRRRIRPPQPIATEGGVPDTPLGIPLRIRTRKDAPQHHERGIRARRSWSSASSSSSSIM